MILPTRTLQVLAWAVLASTTSAQNVVDGLSFGHKDGGSISPNGRGIPNWRVSGEGHAPEIYSDRIVLTPPYPGNKRGSMWTENPSPHNEWTVDFYFRANGQERSGGNLQLWYADNGPQTVSSNSMYSVGQFDGLAVVLDPYGNTGGSIRGFLNDGTKSFKDHHSVDTLSFGMCDYSYRNLGRFSLLQLKQTADNFQVLVDNRVCFESNKVQLPPGYFFGVTAASAEIPDSFEIHKFIMTTTNSRTREEIRRPPPAQQQNQKPQGQADGGWQKLPDGQQGQQAAYDSIPDSLNDIAAGQIKSAEQFADLHNRLQIVNHQINNVFRGLKEEMKKTDDLLELLRKQEERHAEIMNRLIPAHENSVRIEALSKRVESIAMAIQRDVEGKDYREHFERIKGSVEEVRAGITEGLPSTMSEIMTSSTPALGKFVMVIVAVNIMMLGIYITYKKRRENAPKKYL